VPTESVHGSPKVDKFLQTWQQLKRDNVKINGTTKLLQTYNSQSLFMINGKQHPSALGEREAAGLRGNLMLITRLGCWGRGPRSMLPPVDGGRYMADSRRRRESWVVDGGGGPGPTGVAVLPSLGSMESPCDQPECVTCQCPLIVKHILIECTDFRDIRNKYFIACKFMNYERRIWTSQWTLWRSL